MNPAQFEHRSVKIWSLAKIILFIVAVGAWGADVRFQSYFSFGYGDLGAPLCRARDGHFYGTTLKGGDRGQGAVFRVTIDGMLENVHTFTGGEDGANPSAGLVQADDGFLYGTTSGIVGSSAGSVFRVSTEGTLTTLYRFTGLDDGSQPNGLVQASDGALYGTTSIDGPNRSGTVFRVTTNTMLTTLYSFTGQGDGGNPAGTLIQARDGHLYGTTVNGGTDQSGTVFRMTTAGAFATLHRFARTDGAHPWAQLVQAQDGDLYGTAVDGGDRDSGTLFRVGTNGNFTLLHNFAGGSGGANPYGGVVQMEDGNFFGTTRLGGSASFGTVFRLSTNGTFSVVLSFTQPRGLVPGSELTLADDGRLYGITTFGGNFDAGTVFRINPPGGFTVLKSFPAPYTGSMPLNGLTASSDGTLYGTTRSGGASNRGTIFSMGTDGGFRPLYSFTGDDTDGGTRLATLAPANDGNLYGITQSGGINGAGSIYRITPNGVYTRLYSFRAGTGGWQPASGLIQARDNHLYGTTAAGGANGQGTAFRMTLNGALTTIHSFTASVSGGPRAPLIQASDGALYGTSTSGGTRGHGAVYRLTTNGGFTLIHSFTGGTNGHYPEAPLIQASDGRLYGATSFGGLNDAGILFCLTTNGVFTNLHTFSGFDGQRPGGLVQASDSNLYGTTWGNSPGNGQDRYGSVFQITTNGVFTKLYSFTGGTDGAQPSDLVQAADGDLYGTTSAGGFLSVGTVFCIPIAPPSFLPPVLSGDQSIFSFRTRVRQRYTIEARPDFATSVWTVHTSVAGNGSAHRFVVPTDFYPELYFRVSWR
ncbi:MAG TPA: hypothetical protein PLX89_20625 [Verrucomicrobiota bacterium]|nr:hypothetical protein [Verrucomicrobiota bacterium]